MNDTTLTYTLKIIRKPVKHLRIKVVSHNSVIAVTPTRMSDEKVKAFVVSKQKRIHKQLTKFVTAQDQFTLAENQILLHGKAYTVMRREGQGTRYTLDHKSHFVRWGHDILHPSQQIHWYKTYARNFLPARLEKLSKKHGISYNKCFIRDQKTKRGSCSTLGHIGLNWRLIKMPPRVMDYVVLHELAHRTHMNHSPDFRAECRKLCPKTEEARNWLKKYGRALY